MRFPLEVYRAIRKSVGLSFPVGIKINSADFQRGGFTEEESVEVAQTLSKEGIDLIEISGGNYESPVMIGAKKSTQAREAYFLDYCEKVAGSISAPLMLTGGFKTRAGMEEALNGGACQIIGLARSMALNPNFPRDLLNEEPVESLVKPITTGVKALDKLMPLDLTWYTQQLHRMGENKAPDPNASALLSMVKTGLQFGMAGISRVKSR